MAHEQHKKLWGWEEWIVNNDKYCGKILHIEKGYESSLHYHPIKDETFYVIDGGVWLTIGRVGNQATYVMHPGMSYRLQPNMPHKFQSMTPISRVIEFSTPHSDDDVVRIEPSRKLEDSP